MLVLIVNIDNDDDEHNESDEECHSVAKTSTSQLAKFQTEKKHVLQ